MSLAARTAHAVTPLTRARGFEEYRLHRVSLGSCNAHAVYAIVLDDVRYIVSLEHEDGALVVSCTCRTFAEGQVCKHVWATIVAADGSRYLGGPKHASGELRVVLDADGDTKAKKYRPATPEELVAPLTERPPARIAAPARPPPPPPPPPNDWRSVLPVLQAPARRLESAPGEVGYFIDLAQSRAERALSVIVAHRRAFKGGARSPWRALPVDAARVESVTDARDRTILTALRGAGVAPASTYTGGIVVQAAARFSISRAGSEMLAPLICGTGRCYRLHGEMDAEPLTVLAWEEAPWRLRLRVAPVSDRDDWELVGVLRHGDDEVPLSSTELLLDVGLAVLGDKLARIDDGGAASWLSLLRVHGRFRIPAAHRHAFIDEVYALPRLPPLDLPDGWALADVAVPPSPRLQVRPPREGASGVKTRVFAELSFDYDRLVVPARRAGHVALDTARHRLVHRDVAAEAAAAERLAELSFEPLTPKTKRAAPDGCDLYIATYNLPAAVRALLAEGWLVEASGKLYRKPGKFHLGVTSGIDWFDLSATIDFEGVPADLSALIEAIRRRQTTIVLGDGSLGVLPEEWLARYGLLADLGTLEQGQLRFKKSQVSLLDALLAALPEADVDATFAHAREELARLSTITAVDPPASFQGELRPYQREGLGWLQFLARVGFGGCLADDMGLGKTVQVLALLASRRKKRGPRKPSLVVAPRSIIFNWKNEAARFTPELRLLDHTGADRLPPGDHFADHDVVLTTYGTLRRDAAELSAITFDHVILDEATAIKNDRSDTAKAARLLRADHRLALSGTPVENHLGELWSIFEFLNPGVLGRASAFHAATASADAPSADAIALIARALRPFLLRRTKVQVAKDLPDRLEETLMVELQGTQRGLYEDLRSHYRASLEKRIAKDGIARSKMHVLEAILRLRQAACHPGLIDAERRGEGSAKLDALFDELPSLREKGQKALVFSQFTSLLSIVRERLDAEGVAYEYLDGQTRDREARVERFQTDPSCLLFLVSLKAGGLGLNLTAAEYVFLLDPWWNPAVEAQAIDRAHRIGQTRSVFAYRLIAQDTIEERIAELQRSKKKLAESVIEGDGGLLHDLTAEDLTLLLS